MKAVIAEMPPHWLAERRAAEVSQWDEMWEGVLHVAPMPNRTHQRFARDLLLFLQLHWAKPLGAEVHQEVNLAPEDVAEWTKNYRIPDLVLLTPDRFHIDKNEYMAGAPLAVVEIASPGDESAEKLPFYAGLGVPEVWFVDRDTKAVELRTLADGAYSLASPDADGWLVSPATGVAFQPAPPNRVRVRVGEMTAVLPDA